jgi:O-antigen/teichoic acid export membrane protein
LPVDSRYALLLGASLLLMALAVVAIRYLYSRPGDAPVQRLARNSLLPMSTSLLNKLLDMGFAMYMLRVLDVDAVGKLAFAVVIVSYMDILANFGLGTLLTREVAADRAASDRHFGNTLVTRLILWAMSMGVVAVLLGPGAGPLGITPDVGLAILLLATGLLPSLVASTISALFMAYERFEYPAAVTVLTTLLKITLGVAVLVAGWGFVGLAAISIVVNSITLAVLVALALSVLARPRLQFQAGASWRMVAVSYPLMLNNLLNSIFFRVDSLMIKPMVGNTALGWYNTAYKFLDGLGIVSSSFTLALFPLMSQYAKSSRESLARAFGFAVKLMLVVSFPISVGTFLIAPEIITIFAGEKYLPHSAIALQILIWFLPFSFVNGVTQYLLIAINQQRFITFSFLIATSFNLATNLMLIPVLGYAGAALTTVVSELVLMAPFWYCVRRHLPPVPLLGIAWRPAVAAAVMGLGVWAIRDWSLPLAVAVAPMVYAAGLLALRTFDEQELALLGKLFRR